MRIFSDWTSVKEFRCRNLRARAGTAEAVDDRQTRLPGFSQAALSSLACGVIGAGGIGGFFTVGAVKKGIGTLFLYDGDPVAGTNLNRQHFTPRDLGKNKAVSLARHASRQGFMGTRLVAVPLFFQAAVERGLAQPSNTIFCAVDNDETRLYVARHYLDRPVVFAAVTRDAGQAAVAVQEPGQACFACMQPTALEPETSVPRDEGRCLAHPAVVDTVGLAAMLALYAIDSLVMERPRTWNFRQISLAGNAPEIKALLPKRENCPICGRPDHL